MSNSKINWDKPLELVNPTYFSTLKEIRVLTTEAPGPMPVVLLVVTKDSPSGTFVRLNENGHAMYGPFVRNVPERTLRTEYPNLFWLMDKRREFDSANVWAAVMNSKPLEGNLILRLWQLMYARPKDSALSYLADDLNEGPWPKIMKEYYK